MQIVRVDRATAQEASGVVIVIDVIRAFTVAGYALAAGASGLWLVRTVEEAQALRARDPQALLAGEVDGRLIAGFDLNNSPSVVKKAALQGKRLIQRTGAGTQGAVGAANADTILLCALTNAQATATYARSLAQSAQSVITLLPTGAATDFVYGDEDGLCADYVEALLQGRDDAQELLDNGIVQLRNSGRFDLWEKNDPDFPAEDITAVLDVNRFDFAIVGTHQHWQDITYVDATRKSEII